MFPFEVPADLTALSADEFAALQKTVNEFAKTTAADDSASEDLVIATAELFSTVKTEGARRAESAEKAKAARAALAAGVAPDEPEGGEDDKGLEAAAAGPEGDEDEKVQEPVPVSPAPAPTTPPAPAPERVEARSTIDATPATEERTPVGSLIASAAAPSHKPITSFADVGKLLDTQFGRYGRPGAGRGAKTPMVPGGSRFRMEGGRSVQRHSIAAIQREYPQEFRIT